MTASSAYLHAGLARYFETEEHSDCTIICGPYHFNVHKIVIGAQSEYFKTAFKAGNFQEAKTGTIELKAEEPESDGDYDECDDPEIVKLMVHFFYHLDYLVHNETMPKIHLTTHVKMFAMASKYQVPALHDLSFEKFMIEAARYWNKDEFAHAIELIYDISPIVTSELRKKVVDIIHRHRDALLARDSFASLLQTVPDLARDLLLRDRPTEIVPCDCEASALMAYTCHECTVGVQACSWCVEHASFIYCAACEQKAVPGCSCSTCTHD